MQSLLKTLNLTDWLQSLRFTTNQSVLALSVALVDQYPVFSCQANPLPTDHHQPAVTSA